MRSSTIILGMTVCAAAVAPGAAANPDRLQGEWVSDCGPARPGSSKASIVRLIVRGDRISAVGQLYATAKCDVPILRGGHSGKIRRLREHGDQLLLDYTLGDPTFTLRRQDVVDHYNKVAECGLRLWQLNVAKSVAGRRCGRLDVPQRGQLMFETVWLDGNELRMGAFPLSTSNRSARARPLSPGAVVFRRVASADR